MAKIDTISLTGDNKFKDIGTESVLSIVVCNTDTTDITFDFIIAPKTLHGLTSTTNAFFVLKDVPVPTGSSFVWDGEDVLSQAFKSGSIIKNYQDARGVFTVLSDNTFLIRSGSGHTADVTLRRI